MALKILQPGTQPIGQFDLIDSYGSSLLGGEIGTVYQASKTNSLTETAAADVRDGYDNTTSVKRLGIANRINAASQRPLFLLDEGMKGYGTLFGTTVGIMGTVTAYSGGVPSWVGSGKVTCWHQAGLYGVTPDAVNTATDGLTMTNTAVVPGLELHVLNNGKLTPAGSSGAVAVEVARFLEWDTSPFIVNTPMHLVVGGVSAAMHAVIHYKVES